LRISMSKHQRERQSFLRECLRTKNKKINYDIFQSEIKELFHFILRYTPQTIELETRFKPFIPDYVPAVGDIDAFIKVQRPDGKQVNQSVIVSENNFKDVPSNAIHL